MSQAAHIIRFTVRPDSAEDLQEAFGRALPHILEDTTTVSERRRARGALREMNGRRRGIGKPRPAAQGFSDGVLVK